MIDISNYRLLTPSISTLNVETEITVFYRDGEIVTYEKDKSTQIDLTKVMGTQDADFNLVFYNRSTEFVENCQRSEDLK
jgi:hypothetical protein